MGCHKIRMANPFGALSENVIKNFMLASGCIQFMLTTNRILRKELLFQICADGMILDDEDLEVNSQPAPRLEW